MLEGDKINTNDAIMSLAGQQPFSRDQVPVNQLTQIKITTVIRLAPNQRKIKHIYLKPNDPGNDISCTNQSVNLNGFKKKISHSGFLVCFVCFIVIRQWLSRFDESWYEYLVISLVSDNISTLASKTRSVDDRGGLVLVRTWSPPVISHVTCLHCTQQDTTHPAHDTIPHLLTTHTFRIYIKFTYNFYVFIYINYEFWIK